VLDDDENHGGVIDEGELEPNDPSGNVCDDETNTCVPGCRQVEGSLCPDGEECDSPDAVTIGECFEPDEPELSYYVQRNGFCNVGEPGQRGRLAAGARAARPPPRGLTSRPLRCSFRRLRMECSGHRSLDSSQSQTIP